MQPGVIIFLSFIILLVIFPMQAERVIMVLVFGAIAGGLGFLVFLAAREAVREPGKADSFPQLFKLRLIETISTVLVIAGLFGFTMGLFLASLGFEPTTENGTKLWVIAGFVIIAGGALRLANALLGR